MRRWCGRPSAGSWPGTARYIMYTTGSMDIVEVTNRIAALVPEASVAFAHGQMREHELEQIMADFINGEIDVLVSTTIIETGLDISNVNTMIIHDADQMGLSQLYQLRGPGGPLQPDGLCIPYV